jgi:hypothetical protein
MKKNKAEIIGNDLTDKSDKRTLGKTFLVALFIGLILILFSIILDDILLSGTLTDKLLFLIGIANNLLKNLGVAIIIAYIFTYISGTNSFVEFIKDKLISIIITKDFLNKLSNDERREMLNTILKPTKEIASVYSGINDYFNKHITKSLALFETHFRSSYQLNAIAKIDENKKIVRVDTKINYRMYKVSGKFERLNVGFEDENAEEQPVEIFSPDGERYEIKTKPLDKEGLASKENDVDFNNDPSLVKGYVALLPDELKQYDYLDIIKRITEFGNDHWHLFTFRTTQPCDKLSIYITCESNLVIKKYVTFGKINSFNIDCQNDNRIINIFCNEWMEAGLGVAILIAKIEPA